MIEKVDRYDVKGRKYISTQQKYYFTDLGLLYPYLQKNLYVSVISEMELLSYSGITPDEEMQD